ncbi:hypothetical protein N7494_010834 [Penicillium frequentans]|uniref:Uncharacterized protein n=1 Tax=Penicillium frequentans TaxID=3151616 RepID=A0AAD6CIM8_9EURO|nr:hypothetical protein N7494_010834 [Penicillium glabrum]
MEAVYQTWPFLRLTAAASASGRTTIPSTSVTADNVLITPAMRQPTLNAGESANLSPLFVSPALSPAPTLSNHAIDPIALFLMAAANAHAQASSMVRDGFVDAGGLPTREEWQSGWDGMVTKASPKRKQKNGTESVIGGQSLLGSDRSPHSCPMTYGYGCVDIVIATLRED